MLTTFLQKGVPYHNVLTYPLSLTPFILSRKISLKFYLHLIIAKLFIGDRGQDGSISHGPRRYRDVYGGVNDVADSCCARLGKLCL